MVCGIGVTYARNLLVIFALWELAALALWRLVAYHRGEEELAAATWAWLVNFGSAALMLVGLGLILVERGTLNLDVLRGQTLPFWPATLVLGGILAKAATLPLYIWVPRAYRAAPVPVCAILSGVAENIGIILFFKLFVLTMRVPDVFMAMVAGLAVVSSLVAGGISLDARYDPLHIAYSAVSQSGSSSWVMSVRVLRVTGRLLYVAAHSCRQRRAVLHAGII